MRLLVVFLVLFQMHSFAGIKKTIKNGRWSDPTVWGGRTANFLPKDNDTIYVEHYITLDQQVSLKSVYFNVKSTGVICGLYSFTLDFYSILNNQGTISVSSLSLILRGVTIGGGISPPSSNSGTLSYQTSYEDCFTFDISQDCIGGNRATQQNVSCIKYPEVYFSRKETQFCKKTCLSLYLQNEIIEKDATYSWTIEDPEKKIFSGTTTEEFCYTKDTEISVILSAKNKVGTDTIYNTFTLYVSNEVAVSVLPSDTVICEGDILPIKAKKPSASAIWWTSVPGIDCVNCANTTYKAPKNIYFTQIAARVRNGECYGWDTINIRILKNEKDFLRDTAICKQGVISIPGIYGTDNVTWDDGSTQSFHDVPTRGTGIYKATINNSCGIKTDSAFVKYSNPETIFIPNVFTPNNDNTNDTFEIQNLDTYEKTLLTIYNRWGMKIFESADKFVKWDAQNEADGLYFYNLEREDCFKNTVKQHGAVQVIR